MQFIEISKLKPGMRLAKPIYNKIGVMLYDRDTKLTVKGINSIAKFNLIGLYILEPAEPLPPLSQDDLDFEQFQTVSVFQIRDIMMQILTNQEVQDIGILAQNILRKYGGMDHKINFTQSIRSTSDYVYKQSINTGILAAMISNQLGFSYNEQFRVITAALLYNIGYLFLDQQQILNKHKQFTQYELDMLRMSKKKGLDKLSEERLSDLFPPGALEIIQQMVLTDTEESESKSTNTRLLPGTKILRVADTYDRMTAMNMEESPVSEVSAIRHLKRHAEKYEPAAVNALVQAIKLLPTGCSVDLSNGEKALVVEENPMNFQAPVVLLFSNNKMLDLSDPEIAKDIQILDTMKTMDNRIHIDEETLKQFQSDENLNRTLEKFRRARQRSQEADAKKAASEGNSGSAEKE